MPLTEWSSITTVFVITIPGILSDGGRCCSSGVISVQEVLDNFTFTIASTAVLVRFTEEVVIVIRRRVYSGV